jgi:hypothetical protein
MCREDDDIAPLTGIDYLRDRFKSLRTRLTGKA